MYSTYHIWTYVSIATQSPQVLLTIAAGEEGGILFESKVAGRGEWGLMKDQGPREPDKTPAM